MGSTVFPGRRSGSEWIALRVGPGARAPTPGPPSILAGLALPSHEDMGTWDAGAMTNLPSCRSCHTDEHLEYSNYVPATTRTVSRGRTTKHIPQLPEVDWRCQKCGLFDGRSVPVDWRPPSP